MSQIAGGSAVIHRNVPVKFSTALVIVLLCVCVGMMAQDGSGERGTLTEKKLFPRDALAESRFGYSAGVSGDRMVIGAFIADGLVPNAGAAYVFERKNGRWIQTAKLFADDGASQDGFGTSAGISGDTIVIGSPFATVDGVQSAGAAYVFHWEHGEWVQQAKLPSPDPREFGDFGDDLGVAISGDTIVVADATAFRLPATFGAVSVYTRSGSSWKQTARLTVDNERSFGSSVAIDKDTLVVGAASGNAGQVSFAGAAYIFQRNHGRWTRQARLTAGDATQAAGLGFSVGISGDLVALGAINAENSGRVPGAVYVFARDNRVWTQQAKLVAGDGVNFDLLGFRVAINGSTVLAGAEGRALGNSQAVGAAYVFEPKDGVWSQMAELIPSDGMAFELFGCSIALDHKTLLVGAGGQTTKIGQGAGEAYTYHLGGTR